MARAGGDMVLVVAGTDPLEILFTSFSHVRVCDTASKCRSSYTDIQRVSFPPSYLFFRLSRFSIPRLGIEMETSLGSRPVISRIGDERRWPDRRGSGPSVRAQMAQLVAVLSRIRCLSYAFQCLGWLWTALDGIGWLFCLETREILREKEQGVVAMQLENIREYRYGNDSLITYCYITWLSVYVGIQGVYDRG